MIHIDIHVSALNEDFEFRCDEEASVSRICKDIYETLVYVKGAGQKEEGGERQGSIGTRTEFWLCDPKQQRILDREKSLEEQGIIHGSYLMMI